MKCNWQVVACVPALAFEPFVQKTRWFFDKQGDTLSLARNIEDLLELANFNVTPMVAADGTMAFLLYEEFMGWRLIMTDIPSV